MSENSMQQPLFIESIEDALTMAVKAMGGSKKVGSLLWPALLADAAGTKLSDCLNPNRREKLELTEAMWILREARKVNFHSAMDFVCDDAGYEKPKPINPESERDILMREFIDAQKLAAKNLDRMERLQVKQLRSVA